MGDRQEDPGSSIAKGLLAPRQNGAAVVMEVMDGVQPEIAIAMGTAVVVMIVYIMYNLMKTPKPFLQQQDRKTKVPEWC